MSQITPEKLRQQIYEDWGKQENIAIYCDELLSALLFGDLNPDNITFDNLIKVVKPSFWGSEPVKELLKIVPYITGDHTHLLDIRMYFLDDNGDRYELTESQMRTASKGQIFHPTTEIELDYVEASSKVFMYFVASDLIKSLSATRRSAF